MDGDSNAEIVPFRIPWNWRNDEIESAFVQWLKENRPESLPEPERKAKPTGAGSHLRQVKKNLKSLAAWRLIQHHKGDHDEAYHHPGAAKYLGKAYAHASEWTEARKTVQAAQKQIPQFLSDAENFASTK